MFKKNKIKKYTLELSELKSEFKNIKQNSLISAYNYINNTNVSVEKDTRLEELIQEINQIINTEYENIENEIENTQIQLIEGKSKKIDEKISQIKESIDYLRTTIISLEKSLERKIENIKKYQNKYENIENKYSKMLELMANSITNFTFGFNNLKAEILKVKQLIVKFSEIITPTENDENIISEAENKIDAINKYIIEINQNLNRANDLNARWQKSNAQYQKYSSEEKKYIFNEEIYSLKNKIEELQKFKNNNYESDINKFADLIDSVEVKINDIEEKLLSEQINKEKINEIKVKYDEINLFNSQIYELIEKYENLKKTINLSDQEEQIKQIKNSLEEQKNIRINIDNYFNQTLNKDIYEKMLMLVNLNNESKQQTKQFQFEIADLEEKITDIKEKHYFINTYLFDMKHKLKMLNINNLPSEYYLYESKITGCQEILEAKIVKETDQKITEQEFLELYEELKDTVNDFNNFIHAFLENKKTTEKKYITTKINLNNEIAFEQKQQAKKLILNGDLQGANKILDNIRSEI